MGKSVTGEKLVISRARAAFTENLFEAGSVNGGVPQHSMILILEPTSPDIAKVMAEEERLAKLAWPPTPQDPNRPTNMLAMIRAANGQALKPGALKAKFDGFMGNHFISANLKTRPTIVDRRGKPLTQADGVIYSGCFVLAHISLWTQDNNFGQKINANLLGVQFIEDGDAFSGGATPAAPTDFTDLGAAPEEADDLMS